MTTGATFQKTKKKYRTIFISICIIIALADLGAIVFYKNIQYRIIREDIKFTTLDHKDSNLLAGIQYIIQGKIGGIITSEEYYSMFNKDIVLQKYPLSYPANNEITVSGTKDINTLKAQIISNFNSLINILKGSSKDSISTLVEDTDKLTVDNPDKLSNIQTGDITFVANSKPIILNKDQVNINIGSLQVSLNNCSKKYNLNFDYNISSSFYLFSNVKDFIAQLCAPQPQPQPSQQITYSCTDCTYFPIDKQYGLSSSYVPPTSIIDTITGGQRFYTPAKPDLLNLYQGAIQNGTAFAITSGYRSYQTQVYTYNAWVQTELNKGENLATAQANANTYSAKPGHSEHQLGVAVDLTAKGCAAFDRNCAANNNLWNWLASNAWKYGFILSYPPNKENLTGYIYEPWHYRWIGKDLAAEYHSIESQTYLAAFLRNKDLWH